MLALLGAHHILHVSRIRVKVGFINFKTYGVYAYYCLLHYFNSANITPYYSVLEQIVNVFIFSLRKVQIGQRMNKRKGAKKFSVLKMEVSDYFENVGINIPD